MKKDIQNSIQKIIIGSFFCFVLFFCIPTHHVSASLTDGLVGHWTFDGKDTTWTTATAGTVRDLSGNSNTGTLTSMSRATSTGKGKIGQGLKFDGVARVATANSNILGTTASTSFTISGWFNTSGALGAEMYLAEYGGSGAISIRLKDVNTVVCSVRDSSNGFITSNALPRPQNGQWHLFVCIYDATARTFTIGVDTNTTTPVSTALLSTYDNPGQFFLGSRSYGTTGFFGTLDDVRIYNRALSATEIAQLYKLGGSKVGVTPTRSVTASTTGAGLGSGLVGHWTLDGTDTRWATSTTYNTGSNGNNGTLVGLSSTSSAKVGKIGQGIFLARSATSAISIGTNPKPDNDFTISFWTYPTVSQNAVTFVTNYNGFGGGSITIKDNSFTLSFSAGTSSSISTTKLSTYRWYHITAVRNSVTGVLSIYKDGVLAAASATGVSQGSVGYTVNKWLTFGGGADSNGVVSASGCGCIMDDLRIYDRVLSATEIAQLYLQGVTRVGTSPTKNIVSGTVASTTCTSLNCGLVGYWTFDGKDTTWTTAATGTVRDLSGNGYSGTTTGMNRTSSPVRGKIGQGLKFDGIDDYVNISYTDLYTSARYKGTVCAWFRPSKAYNSGAIDWIINRSGISGSEFQMGHYNNNNIYFGFVVDGRYFIAANASNWKQNTWQQYCTVWDSAANKIYAYFDGNLLGSTTGFSGISGSTKILIGVQENTPNNYFTGSIDDVRVYGRALSAAEVRQLYSLGQIRRR